MRVVPLNSCDDVALWSAKRIINKINTFQPTPEKPFVLGLPTGGTPLKTYKKLIEFYNKGIVSFKNVVTFNMDEYVGLEKDNPQSYHYFMHHNFFSKIDILPENINILDGMSKNYEEVCPTNHMVPFSTPRHLQDAADKELDKLLQEPVEHLTDW